MGDAGARIDGSGALPPRLTRLVGREEELSALLDEADGARLLTLTGAPGGGKTRLAVECAVRLAPRFPGGVAWVELAPTTGPLVAAAAATALGIREDPGQPMLDTLVESLRRIEPVLLILDNCEHVLAEVVELVRALIEGCPGLRILATSRAPLGLVGERVWYVRGLGDRAAVELFVDRAKQTAIGFGIDGVDEGSVAEICARLDGLPLAIELAAAWARVLSPRQIADRLAEAEPLLASPSRDVVERHKTMAATVDWTYELLSSGAQRLFEQLSVFAGSFDIDAVEAVAATDTANGGVLEPLSQLVDHSLVVAVGGSLGPMRYRLLEPVRQCGMTLLQARGGASGVRRRHAEHYLDMASRFDPFGLRWADPPMPLAALVQDQANLLAALDWARSQPPDLALRLCEAMAPSWVSIGRINEGRAWLSETLAMGTSDALLHTRAATWAAVLAWRQGDYEQSHVLFDEAVSAARAADERRALGVTLFNLAMLHISEGDTDRAIACCHECIAMAESVGDDRTPIMGRINLGWAHYVAGDVAAGDAEVHAALDVDTGIREHIRGLALFALQYGAFLARDPVAQRGYLIASQATASAQHVLQRSDWLGSAAALAVLEGRYHTALRLMGGSISQGRRRGSQSPRAISEPITALLVTVWDNVDAVVADRLLAQGERMSWDQLTAVALADPADAGADESLLTAREHEVAVLVAQGLGNADIAQKLAISRRTVESHLDHIRQKLNFSSRNQIMTWILQGPPYQDRR